MGEEVRALIGEPLVVINVGVATFGDSLARQGTPVTQVDWVPPAAGDQEMIDLLDDLL